MPQCPKGTRTKGLAKKYTHNARVSHVLKREKTERFLKKREFVERRLAELQNAAGDGVDHRSALERVPTTEGVMPKPVIEPKRGPTLDAEAYRTATRAASGAAGAASTSGGLIGRLAFGGNSDLALIEEKKREREAAKAEARIGSAARKKKKKNKKLNALRARC